jgi:hypothetical protein
VTIQMGMFNFANSVLSPLHTDAKSPYPSAEMLD